MSSFSSRSTDELGVAPIPRLLWRFSIPAICALIVTALYSLVDRLFLAHYTPVVPPEFSGMAPDVSNALMAGLGFAMPYMLFVAAFGILVGAGSASALSIAIGAGNKGGAERIVGQSVTLMVLFASAVAGLSFVFLDSVLAAFGAEGLSLHFASSYMKIILFGALPMHLSYATCAMIQAEGRATMSMVVTVIGAGLNILLDPVFIFGWCGIPAMGIEGAAWATNLSMTISGAIGLWYLASRRSPIRLRLGRISLYRIYAARVLLIGMTPAIVQVLCSAVQAIFIRGYEVWGGDEANMLISAIVIIQGVHMIVLMPACGIAQGSQPIIGFNFGAGKYKRMMECTTKATWYAVLLGLVFCLVMMVGAPAITRAFVPETKAEASIEMVQEVESSAGTSAVETINEKPVTGQGTARGGREKLYRKTVWGMRLLAIGFPLYGIPLMLCTFYQSIGRTKAAFIASLMHNCLILVPLVLILPYVFGGVDGVWYAQPITDVICAILGGLFLWLEKRRIDRKSI